MIWILWKSNGGKIKGIDDRFLKNFKLRRNRFENGEIMAQQIVTQNIVRVFSKRVQRF